MSVVLEPLKEEAPKETMELINPPKVKGKRGNPQFKKEGNEEPYNPALTPEELAIDGDIVIETEEGDVRLDEIIGTNSNKQFAVFLCYAKETRILLGQVEVGDKKYRNIYAQFKNRKLRTSDAKIIDLIRRSEGLYNVHIFESSLPEHIKRKIREDNRMLTSDPTEHESDYEPE